MKEIDPSHSESLVGFPYRDRGEELVVDKVYISGVLLNNHWYHMSIALSFYFLIHHSKQIHINQHYGIFLLHPSRTTRMTVRLNPTIYTASRHDSIPRVGVLGRGI